MQDGSMSFFLFSFSLVGCLWPKYLVLPSGEGPGKQFFDGGNSALVIGFVGTNFGGLKNTVFKGISGLKDCLD